MAVDNTQFSIAVHILVGVAKHQYVNTAQLAQSVNTNPVFIKRIVGTLAKSGLLVAARGRHGGNRLAQLQDVVNNPRGCKVLVSKGRLLKLAAKHQDLVPTDGNHSN